MTVSVFGGSSTMGKIGNKLMVGNLYNTTITYEFLKSKILEVLAALRCICLHFLVFVLRRCSAWLGQGKLMF
jgi:hypothetical protein